MLDRLGINISKYFGQLTVVVFFHICTAIFTIVSIPMIIPLLQILFYGNSTNESTSLVSGLESQIKQIVAESISDNGQQKTVLFICAAFILIFFGRNLCRYFAMYFMTPIRNSLIQDLRSNLFKSYLTLPINTLKSQQKGNLLSILMADVNEAEVMLRYSLETIIKSPLIIIGAVVFMLYLDPRLTLFVFILMVFTILVIGGVSRSLKKDSAQAQAGLGQINAMGEESLSAYTVIRSYTAESFMLDKFQKFNNAYKQMMDKVLWRRDLASPLSEFLGVTIVAVLLWFGSNRVFNSSLSPEAFFAFLFAFFQVIEPSKSFATAYFNVQKGMAAIDRISEFMPANADIDFEVGKPNIEFNTSIEFNNVNFKYDDSEQVLKDLSFNIKKGEIIAIAGPSGVGKTTIVNLLHRFIECQTGTITIDGRNLVDINIGQLRQMFSLVDQQVSLFHDSIANNIAMGIAKPDINRITIASKDAYAFDFIEKLPNGMAHNIGDQGLKLSGGQRQRIALARAFYKQSEILILDEATSSIDAESEELIKQALVKKNTDEGITIILIAHQSNIADIAHRTIELNDGRVV